MGSTEIAGGGLYTDLVSVRSSTAQGSVSPSLRPLPCGQPLVFNVCVWDLAFELKFGNLFFLVSAYPVAVIAC